MSQNDDLLAHLKSGQKITTLTAMSKYGICRLSESCRELEAHGHRIDRDTIKITNRHGRPVKLTVYALAPEQTT